MSEWSGRSGAAEHLREGAALPALPLLASALRRLPLRYRAFPANGNRTQVNGAFVGTYDTQDRLTALNGTTYTYTNRGTLKGIGARAFTYDLSGGLLSATAVTGGATVTYALDGFGRRVQKSVSGVLQAQWVYDERGRILAEYDGSIVRQVFGYGARSTPELMYQPTTGHLYRLVSDWRGSVRLVLDLSAGSTPVVKQRIDYDAWGVATEWVASDPAYRPVSLGFAGGLWDRDTGLVRFGARDYDPATGRWTAKDPIRFSGGLNLYVYANNDPINFVDVTGRTPTRGWFDGFDHNREAVAEAKRHFGNDLWNTQGDAFKHCYASCRATQKMGEHGRVGDG